MLVLLLQMLLLNPQQRAPFFSHRVDGSGDHRRKDHVEKRTRTMQDRLPKFSVRGATSWSLSARGPRERAAALIRSAGARPRGSHVRGMRLLHDSM